MIAIDPGNEQSAYVTYDTHRRTPVQFEKLPNTHLVDLLDSLIHRGANTAAIEMIASYGMPVGQTVFETCVWVGRFTERFDRLAVPVRLVYRQEVKLHLCGTPRAKDSNIRQALIDRYGPGRDIAVGTKAKPGPLYGVRSDMWAALAVAITATETLKEIKPA